VRNRPGLSRIIRVIGGINLYKEGCIRPLPDSDPRRAVVDGRQEMRYKEISEMGKPKIPSLPLTSAILVFFLCCPAVVPAGEKDPKPGQPAWVEPGVDRPGSDFKILWLRGGPEACLEACAQNPLCKSYTYVREGVAGRMEGCWLKDDIPPPVEDGCCVSGVKTSEALSLVVRKPVAPRREEPKPLEKPEPPPEKIPETGSGRREAAGMNFSGAPHGTMKAGRAVLPAAPAPSKAGTGAGRREVAGMDFSTAPFPATSRSVAWRAVGEAPATGTGRRGIEGVHYEASPPSVRSSVPGVQRTGAATRKITGVDITAVPPPR
jgi:hypothetical protein